MKFKCKDNSYEEINKKHKPKAMKNYKWHKCFAWTSVHITRTDCRWLETIERRLYKRDRYTVDSGLYVFPSICPEWEYRDSRQTNVQSSQ